MSIEDLEKDRFWMRFEEIERRIHQTNYGRPPLQGKLLDVQLKDNKSDFSILFKAKRDHVLQKERACNRAALRV